MADYFGKSLDVGDKVVFMQLGYRSLLVGEIVKVMDKMVLISHKKTNVCSSESKQYKCQVIKISETDFQIKTQRKDDL